MVKSAEQYKEYLRELYDAKVTKRGNLRAIGIAWGRSNDEFKLDISRVDNLDLAVNLFLERATKEYWQKY